MSRKKVFHKSSSGHVFHLWLFSGILALALAIVIGNQAYAQTQLASDDAAIKQVVLKAAGASLQAVVVPHTLANYTTSYATATSPSKVLAASSADLAVAQTQAHTLFNSVYDTKCVPCQLEANKTYQALQSEQKGVFRALAWGIRDIEWRQVFINGQTASVTLAVTLWSKVQYINEFGKLNTITPTGGEVIIYSLAKTGGVWLITNQVPDSTAADSLPVNHPQLNGQTGGPPPDMPVPPAKVKK